MWFENLGVVSIGAQSAGSDDGGLGMMKRELWKLFVRHCRRTGCSSVRHYALVLRISSHEVDFGREGIDRIRFDKRNGCVGADIVIPVSAWRPKSRTVELRDYLSGIVRDALKACVARVQAAGEIVDDAELFHDIDAALLEFRSMDLTDKL